MKVKFYTTEKYKKYLLRQVGRVVERHNMGVDVVDGGRFVVDVKTGAFGVFDKRGKLVRSSLQWCENNTNCTPLWG
jgi:hypothetical protein